MKQIKISNVKFLRNKKFLAVIFILFLSSFLIWRNYKLKEIEEMMDNMSAAVASQLSEENVIGASEYMFTESIATLLSEYYKTTCSMDIDYGLIHIDKGDGKEISYSIDYDNDFKCFQVAYMSSNNGTVPVSNPIGMYQLSNYEDLETLIDNIVKDILENVERAEYFREQYGINTSSNTFGSIADILNTMHQYFNDEYLTFYYTYDGVTDGVYIVGSPRNNVSFDVSYKPESSSIVIVYPDIDDKVYSLFEYNTLHELAVNITADIKMYINEQLYTYGQFLEEGLVEGYEEYPDELLNKTVVLG